MPKQPFLFDEMSSLKPPPAEHEKVGDVELLREESNEWKVSIKEKIFGGIFIFHYDPSQDKVVYISNQGTNFEYPSAKKLKEEARWIAEKALLSKGMYEKRKQKKL